MILKAEVDETDIARVAVGQKAKIRIQAWPDRVFKGVVRETPLAVTMGGMGGEYFEVEILLESEGERILSGLTADVDIEIETYKEVLSVPSQAVLSREVDELPPSIREGCPEVDAQKRFTSVVYRAIDGKATVTPVRIGGSDATHTVIRSGITQEDRVIVGPYKVLEGIKHDQRVKDQREVEKEKKEKGKAAANAGGRPMVSPC